MKTKLFLLSIALSVIALALVLDVQFNLTSGSLVFAAMTGIPWSERFRIYREGVARDLRYKPVEPLGAWLHDAGMGWIGGMGEDKAPVAYSPQQYSQKSFNATGKIIEMANVEFTDQVSPTLNIDIPLKNRLAGDGVYGAQTRRGKETIRTMSYMHASMDVLSKPVLVRSDVLQKWIANEQTKIKVLTEQFNSAFPDLANWMQRYLAVQPYYALLYRYSHNLFAPESTAKKTKSSHPFIVVAGKDGGRIAYSSTPATYEGNILEAVNGLSAAANTAFSTKFIDAMVQLAPSAGLVPFQEGELAGMYDLKISPNQFAQLQRDEEYQDAMKFAVERGKNNPYVNGILSFPYHQCMIRVDRNCPGVSTNVDSGWDVNWSVLGSTSSVMWGKPDYMDNPIDSSVKSVCFLSGQSALVGAYNSKGIIFDEETWDYNSGKGQVAEILFGFERGDIYDMDGTVTGTAGTFEKTGSMLGITYSPAPSFT